MTAAQAAHLEAIRRGARYWDATAFPALLAARWIECVYMQVPAPGRGTLRTAGLTQAGREALAAWKAAQCAA